MKIKIRELIFGLALLLLTPMGAQAQFTFVTNNGAITITRYTGFGAPVAVVIPETTNGYPVTTIGTYAFLNNTNVTSVIIPNSVTSLASNAFVNCFRLTNVTIGSGVTSIGDQAFYNCGLRSVTIPNSVTSIGNLPFYGSSFLTDISVAADNSSYSSANGVLFDKTQAILIQFPEGQAGNYSIPGSVTSIGNYAFYNCRRLTSVTIPNSVTSIGDQVFWYCSGLTNISVAADNPSYSSANGVLFDKTQAILIQFPDGRAGNYVIPNSVTSIGFGAFFGCDRLSNTTIPNSVTTIGDFAFQYCWGLTNVTIPSSVTSIGDWAFSYCPGLTNITCQGNAPALGGGNVFSNVHASAKVYYFPGTSGWGPTYGGLPTVLVEDFTYEINNGALTITAYTGPGGAVVIPAMTNGYPIVSIGPSAFYGRTDVTSVIIPNSVTSIGTAAFGDCSGLTSVTIGNTVTSIGDAAFARSSLTSVTIPNSVTSIGSSAFYRCSSLTSVTIPDGVTSIAPSVFYGCTSLTSVTIGNGVTSIGHQAFAGTGLTSVTIPNSVTSIGDETFAGSSLTSVTIPNSVTSIGEAAFAHCRSLTNVTIGNSVTTIKHGVFGFSGLTSVTIPSSVTSIQGAPFRYCSSLTNISVAAGNPSYSSADGVLFNKTQAILIQFPGGRAGHYTIPNGVSSIAEGAFLDCRSLTSVIIPYGVTYIEGFAFYLTGLTNVTIPNSVTRIGDYAFSDNSLTSVTIPGSVTSIGDWAFSFCSGLTNITFLGNAPALDAGNVFGYVNGSAKVYYLPGTTGWGPTYGGLPTVMLVAPIALGSAAKKPGGYGFTITAGPNQTIIVEASTNLVNWRPIWTNTLSGASANFTDAQWANYPIRFYRARSN